MKKSMILAGVLCIGYANAQYDGRVGVNTEEPTATLNVKSKTGNNTESTKNFQLENGDGTKMVTVLDNGKMGVGIENPYYKFEVNGIAASINGGLYSIGRNYNEGGTLFLVNELKKESDKARIWGLYNMTGHYGSGLHFFQYNGENSRNLGSRMILSDEGNLGIGKFTEEVMPTARLDVLTGKVRVRSMAGTGDRPVYVDETGVLKIGTATTSNTPSVEIGSTTDMPCNDTNRGKMNFIKKSTGSDIFGICMKNADGNFYWAYMVGGNNPTNGTGAFGSGL